MKVFISHIHEDASLCLVLKDWIESTFVGQCHVFVSSDQDSIAPGEKWFDRIDSELEEAGTLIIICSPVSIGRPWVNFESGCAWIKRIPIIPICHAGLHLKNLPPPLSSFQSLDLEDEGFSKKLITGLARHLSITKIPRIDYASMNSELRKESSITPQPAPSVKIQGNDDLIDEQVEILKFLTQVRDDSVEVHFLASKFKMNIQRMKYHLEILAKNNLLHETYYPGGRTDYALSPNGRAFLVSRNLL